MDRVIVNDALFAEANYEASKQLVGVQLVQNIDVVLQTLNILMEIDYSVSTAKSDRVHWSPKVVDED